MDKVRLLTDERVDLVDAMRLGSLTEDALMRLVQVFFGQTDSGYTNLTDEASLIMPVIWEPVQIASATQTAIPIDISTTAGTITLELRKTGSREARIWGGDGNQLSGANASGTVALSVAAGTAVGVYYIKVRRKETEQRGFPGTSENRLYINRTTQQESSTGIATNTKLLDEWEVSTALSTSAAPSGRYFSVAAFEVALSGGVQKIVAVTNLAGSTTGTFSAAAAPTVFAWKRAKTHAWSSRTAAAQDSFRTLKDIYDALATAIAEMRDGQLWFVDPATQAKFEANGGVKLKNGATLGITGTGFQFNDGAVGVPITLQVYDGQVVFAKGGATYFVGDALTAGRTLWASQDTTRTLRIQTARANATGNVPMEQRWPTAGVPAPNTYLDRYLTTTAGGAERESARANAWTGHWESPHAIIDDDFIGPLSINVGDRSRLAWGRKEPANSLNQEIEFAAGDTVSSSRRWHALRDGSITGVSFRWDLAITAGLATVEVKKNGSVVVSPFSQSTVQEGSVTFPNGLHTYIAGDDLSINLFTNVGFLPLTNNLNVVLEVEDDDLRSLWRIRPGGLVGTPAVTKVLPPPTGGHGVVQVATGSSSGDLLIVEPTNRDDLLFGTAYQFVWKARLYANATSSITLAIGMYAGDALNAMFRLVKGGAPGNTNWFAAVNTSDLPDTEDPGTNTGVPASTTTFQDLEIWMSPAASTFLIDGAVVANLGVVTANGLGIQPRLRLKTTGAAVRSVRLDRMRVYATRGAL